MFSEASVSHSVHRGGGWGWGKVPTNRPGGRPPPRHNPSPRQTKPLGRPPPRQTLPPYWHLVAATAAVGMHPIGTHSCLLISWQRPVPLTSFFDFPNSECFAFASPISSTVWGRCDRVSIASLRKVSIVPTSLVIDRLSELSRASKSRCIWSSITAFTGVVLTVIQSTCYNTRLLKVRN